MIIKQHLNDIFTDDKIIPIIIKCFNNGIVIGSTQGHLLFVQKFVAGDNISFTPIRYTKREKQACVTGLTVTRDQDYFAVSYDSNEIAYFNIKNIFDNLRKIGLEGNPIDSDIKQQIYIFINEKLNIKIAF